MTKNNNNTDLKNNIKEGVTLPSSIVRRCTACGKLSDRKSFIRIIKDYKTGQIIINPDNNHFGRSIYLCKAQECFKLALKKKRLKHLTEDEINTIKNLCN